MALITWSAGIDTVSGALSKPSSNPQHSCEKMLLATHRVAATENPNCNRIFLRRKVQRATAVSAAVRERRKDLSKIAADQAAFQAQKDTAGGKKTMYAFLWKLEGEAYDQQHPKA